MLKILKYFLVFTLLSFVFAITSVAQTQFERGNYVDNKGNKINGYIKNQNWKTNPKTIDFRKTKNSGIEKLSVENIQGFSIGEHTKYVRLSIDPEDKPLLLKHLVEGVLNLYTISGSSSKFFIKTEDQLSAQELIKASSRSSSKSNNQQYQQQLLDVSSCSALLKKIRKTNYKKNDLIDIVLEINSCNGDSDSRLIKKVKEEKGTNLYLLAGVTYSDFKIKHVQSPSAIGLSPGTGYRLGFGLEYMLHNRDKDMSILTDVSYHMLKVDKASEESPWNGYVANVNSIDATISYRWYYVKSSTLSAYLSPGFVYSFGINSHLDRSEVRGRSTLKIINSGTLLSAATGVRTGPIDIEVKFHRRSVLAQASYQASKLQEISLTGRYLF